MMRKIAVTALMVVVLVVFRPVAGSAADTIYTPPLFAGTTASGSAALLDCYVVNTGPGSQHVSITIFSLDGTNITQGGSLTNFPLSPGTGVGAQASQPNAVGVTLGYCRVTGDGPPKSLLVSLCNSARVGATDNCVAAVVGQSQGGSGF